MSQGKSNGQIGRELYLSEDTVKTHARRLFRKLGVRDRAQAVAHGFRRGLVSVAAARRLRSSVHSGRCAAGVRRGRACPRSRVAADLGVVARPRSATSTGSEASPSREKPTLDHSAVFATVAALRTRMCTVRDQASRTDDDGHGCVTPGQRLRDE